MKYRIRALGKYQKAVLAAAVLLVLVFSVLYPVTMGREGYLYRGRSSPPARRKAAPSTRGRSTGSRPGSP